MKKKNKKKRMEEVAKESQQKQSINEQFTNLKTNNSIHIATNHHPHQVLNLSHDNSENRKSNSSSRMGSLWLESQN
jgi:hypothetical protein